jgi:N-acetylglucosaminyldiphosphoundecaprenol N-acetyl-beta-D-mannosaminyltransferase
MNARSDFFSERQGVRVLGAFIDAMDWPEALDTMQAWARMRLPRYICCCNAHSLVTMRKESPVQAAIESAHLALPDGAPVAWMMRKLGLRGQKRLSGPDLMWRYCALAEREGTPIFLYGNTDGVLRTLQARLQTAFPRLLISGMLAPPFRPLTPAETDAVLRRIRDSGAAVVFVSLGCPKQELWMAQQSARLPAVMVGVGAAFDYHAGTLRRAPVWMQHAGLEWLYRLCTEPRRLWRRYFVTNSLFMLGALRQLLQGRRRAAAGH